MARSPGHRFTRRTYKKAIEKATDRANTKFFVAALMAPSYQQHRIMRMDEDETQLVHKIRRRQKREQR